MFSYELENGEIITVERADEGQVTTVERADEGQVTTVEPADIVAPATPHLYQESLLLSAPPYAFEHLRFYSEVLDRIVTVSETSAGGSIWVYRDWLALRTTGGRVEKVFKVLPVDTYVYNGHVAGTKAYLAATLWNTAEYVGCMLCVDLETFTIEWQDSLRVVSPSGYGLYCAFGTTQTTQHAYWVGICKDSDRGIILKYTLAGALVWQKQFTGMSPWGRTHIIENADGSHFIASGAFLEKWDADGNRLWSKKISVQGAGATVFAFFGLIEHEGALYAAVDTWSGAADAFACKLDMGGNVVWHRTYSGRGLEWVSAASGGVRLMFDRRATPHDSVHMVVSSDNEVLWGRKLRSAGAEPGDELWSHGLAAGAYDYVSTYDITEPFTKQFVLPANGSGQGTYGDNAADSIGKWVYENCDEPTAGAQTITMVDDAGLTFPTPYALEAAPEVVELIPIIQHFGANA